MGGSGDGEGVGVGSTVCGGSGEEVATVLAPDEPPPPQALDRAATTIAVANKLTRE